MEHTDHSIRNHYIAAVLAELTVIIVTSIASVAYPPLGHALWLGITQAPPSGWFLVALSMILAGMSGCWVAGLWAAATRAPSTQPPHEKGLTPSPPRKSFGAAITSPTDKEMVSPEHVEIRGTFTGSKEHYWLLNNVGDQYWPHASIQLLADGTWVQKIYVDPQAAARSVHVVLAWVSPSMHGILESWRAKAERYRKYDGIKMTPPTGHFEVVEVRTLQVHPVPEQMKLTLVTSHVEHVLVRGKTYEIEYEIEASGPLATDCWLGSSIKDSSGRYFNNRNEDQPITLMKGKNVYRRKLTVPKDTTPGDQTMSTNVWRGVVGDVSKSKFIVDLPPKRVRIVE